VTRINVRALADSLTEAGYTDATFKATATAARVNGADITFPRPILVAIVAGSPLPSIELEEPDGTWAWDMSVAPLNAPSSVIVAGLFTFAGEEVTWSELTPVDPDSLTPLDPVPPSALEVLVEAGRARDDALEAAERAGDERTAAGVYAGAASRSAADSNDAAVAAGLSSVSAGLSRDEAVGVANGSIVSAVVEGDDLMVTTKAGAKRNAGNVRGLPGAAVPWGSGLGAADLDTITAPGVYVQVDTGTATPERHYPSASTGVLEVYQVTGNLRMQRFTPTSGTHAPVRGVFVRRQFNGTWAASWSFIATQRVSDVAGRAIFTYDDVRGGEQLIYGDTGWRTISAWDAAGVITGDPLPSPWVPQSGRAGALRVRRIGREVFVSILSLGTSGAASTTDRLWVASSGFTPASADREAQMIPWHQANGVYKPLALRAGLARADYFTTAAGDFCPLAQIVYVTDAAWPTTLPGSAFGTIPIG
jgi:hypothetical protein